MLGLLVTAWTVAIGQSNSNLAYRPSFSAVVVSSVATSSKWYANVFSMEEKQRMAEANNYSIVILKSKVMELELLELNGAVKRKDVLASKTAGTQIEGLFKIEFEVENMDEWIKRLNGLKIEIPNIWTDQKTKKRNFIITDPDGNLIQFFEK